MSRVAGLLLIVLSFWTYRAAAYESQCRTAGDIEGGLEPSICSPAGTPECSPGLEAASGRLLGEHTWITRVAMDRAGLPAPLLSQPALPEYMGYGSVGRYSLEPAPPGGMSRRVRRATSIPEFAQVPDVSYGLADYLLGNAHCPVTGYAGDTASQVTDCHTFSTHMGALNSTHFLPQARAMYAHYHRLALDTARQCAGMKAALEAGHDDPIHPVREDVREKSLRECESLALVYEAVGSHFLADAWSTGHMWERWGSPDGSTSPEVRMRSQLTALVSGLMHGWRSVVRDVFAYVDEAQLYEHDQLCRPGTLHAGEAPVQWGYPGSPDRWAGGGDIYLLDCSAPGAAFQTQSVAYSSELQTQKARMLTCIAKGMAEVYDSGPRMNGERGAEGILDPAISGSLDDLCWGQRATNLSMQQGFGVSGFVASQQPEFQTTLVINATKIALKADVAPRLQL